MGCVPARFNEPVGDLLPDVGFPPYFEAEFVRSGTGKSRTAKVGRVAPRAPWIGGRRSLPPETNPGTSGQVPLKFRSRYRRARSGAPYHGARPAFEPVREIRVGPDSG